MAKKKRKPGGDKPRRRRQPDELPDRLMERTMRQLVAWFARQGECHGRRTGHRTRCPSCLSLSMENSAAC